MTRGILAIAESLDPTASLDTLDVDHLGETVKREIVALGGAADDALVEPTNAAPGASVYGVPMRVGDGHDVALGAVADAAVVAGAAGSLLAQVRRLTTDIGALLAAVVAGISIVSKAVAGTPTAHRAGVTAADVLAAPGTVTCTKLTGVGSATAGTYTVFVVAGNTYGRTTATQGNTTVTTETTNLGVRAAFAQVAGATFYDVYMSTDGAAAKWVGRVTETQRASGIIINAVGGTTAGGTANAVDIYVVGTGLAVNGGQLAQNTAFTPETPTAINPNGAQNLDLNVTASRSGDAVALSLVLIPFYAMSGSHYAAGDPISVSFGGVSGSYNPLRQTFRLPCRGRQTVVVVASIAGTGASVDIESVSN